MANKLIDIVQGMSNSAASNVSAPVDGLAWLLRKAGVNVGDAPVGGSDWMRQRGLTAEPQNKLAGILGESLGGVSPMLAAKYAPQISNALIKGGENLAAPRTLDPQTGAIVWHGSPHKFDKFDASKIGTGEGAQAYGHGLYLADSPDVAKGYQNLQSGKVDRITPMPTADGKRVLGTYPRMVAEDIDKTYRGNVQAAIDDAIKTGADKEYIQTAQSFLGKQVESFDRKKMHQGSMYKVDLPDEHIAKMLDWDKPINQQNPQVLEALNNSGILEGARKSGGFFEKDYADLMQGRHLLSAKKNGVANESEMLRQSGIPGIRYLDGGSRGAGAGSSNYVVFPGNENMLSILQRNGQALK